MQWAAIVEESMRKPKSGPRQLSRSSHSSARPEAVAIARQMRAEGFSLRAISYHLAAAGYLNQNHRSFAPKSIVAMLRGPKIEM
jgi:hypothetical protein